MEGIRLQGPRSSNISGDDGQRSESHLPSDRTQITNPADQVLVMSSPLI